MNVAGIRAASAGPELLRGMRVVVTRPREQARRMAAAIEAAGGEALLFPLIEIGDPPDAAALDALIDRLETFDWAVFSSPTAVDRAMQRILDRRAMPAACAIAAIGDGTLRALARHGITGVLAPTERFDSEGLLALPALADLRGRRVLVFRGQEGRKVLGEGLVAAGATVEYAECYTRGRPAGDAGLLLDRAREGQLDAVVITSSEAVRHLVALMDDPVAVPEPVAAAVDGGGSGGAHAALRAVPVFAPHPRIAAAARAAGFAQVIETAGGDSGVLRALIEARRGREPAAGRRR